MDVSEASQVEVRRVTERQVALRTITLIQQTIVLMVLLLATLIAPLTSVLSTDSDEPTEKAGGLFGSFGYFFTEEAETFGDRETHPNGLDAGLLFTQVGLVLLLIAVLGTLVAAVVLWSAQPRARGRVLVVLGIALIVGALVTFLGLTWLPDSEYVTSGTPWLWLPIVAGAWIFYHLWARALLD